MPGFASNVCVGRRCDVSCNCADQQTRELIISVKGTLTKTKVIAIPTQCLQSFEKKKKKKKEEEEEEEMMS